MNNTHGHSLDSWVEDKMSDCCKWSMVRCSKITRRVITLDLYFVRKRRVENWYINATVFLPFKHLNYLYLLGNNIAGVVENGGFDELSKLRNLKGLDLRYNNLNRNILSSLSHLLSLKELYLNGNPLDSPHNNSGHERLSGLKNLEILRMESTKMEESNVLSALNLKDFIRLKDLYISSNKFQSFEPIKDLKDFISLKTLDISYNKFNNSIFQLVKGLPSLKNLYLSGNDIHGQLLIQDTNALSNLEELYLDDNYIEGFETFASFSNGRRLMKLETLHLDNNRFSSGIFKSLKEFPSLKFMSLRENNFHRSEHIQDINALSSLKDLDLSYSSFEDFETSTSFSGVSSQIKNNSHHLQLHLNSIKCNMTKLLQSLATLPSIKSLNLEDNNITSIDAIHALRNLSMLEELFLDDSYLHKDFLQNIGPMNSLKVLSANGAQFQSRLPNKGWCELRNLQELCFSETQLEGTLPPCLENLTSLDLIDLSQNRLIGNIGSSPLSTLKSLKYIFISNTCFEVPSSFNVFANHTMLRGILADAIKVIKETELQSWVHKFQLEVFTMSNCIGLLKLPAFLHYQHNLQIFDISKNNLEGEFPNWLLQNNTELIYILMNSNAFT
nr:receptor-like protein 12 isoform X1 [Ipomoea batatas]